MGASQVCIYITIFRAKCFDSGRKSHLLELLASYATYLHDVGKIDGAEDHELASDKEINNNHFEYLINNSS